MSDFLTVGTPSPAAQSEVLNVVSIPLEGEFTRKSGDNIPYLVDSFGIGDTSCSGHLLADNVSYTMFLTIQACLRNFS